MTISSSASFVSADLQSRIDELGRSLEEMPHQVDRSARALMGLAETCQSEGISFTDLALTREVAVWDLPLIALLMSYWDDDFSSPSHANGSDLLELIKLMVHLGVDVLGQSERNHWQALHLASRIGNLDVVRFLVDQGALVDAQTIIEVTPLMLAAEEGHLEIIDFLIEKGSKVNQFDHHHKHALYYAASEGHLEVVKRLMELQAEVDNITAHGYSSLHLACNNGHPEVVEHLIASGADVHASTDTPTQDHGFHLAVLNNHLSVIKVLLKAGFMIDTPNALGQNALYLATKYKRLDIVQFLVEQGANMHLKDAKGLSAFELSHQGVSKAAICDYLTLVNRIQTEQQELSHLLEASSKETSLVSSPSPTLTSDSNIAMAPSKPSRSL